MKKLRKGDFIETIIGVVMSKLIGLFVLVLPSVLVAQENNQCANEAALARSRVELVSEKYKSAIEAKTTEYQGKAKQIRDESPDPEPIEGVLNFDITVEMKDQEFFLDLPTVTMKDQNMSMDLPQVTMKETEFTFNVPKMTMRTQCTPGIPETVCETYRDDFGIEWPKNCYMRPGPDICLDLPFHENVPEKWIFHAPEITMARTDWVMGVPEFKMETQRIVMGLPEITVKNVSVGVQKAKDQSAALKEEATRETSSLANALKEEAAAAAAEGIGLVFECQEKQFALSQNDSLAKFDSQIDLLRALQVEARARGASDLDSKFQASLDQLLKTRETVVQKFAEAFSKLREARANAMSKTIPGALPELGT